MEKLNLIIEDTINEYLQENTSILLQENFWGIIHKRPLTVYDYDMSKGPRALLAKDKKDHLYRVYPYISSDNKSLKKLSARNSKNEKIRAKIVNFPDNGYIFGGFCTFQGEPNDHSDQIFWAFNKDNEAILFTYNGDQHCCTTLDGEQVKVDFVPEEVMHSVAQQATREAQRRGETPPSGAEPLPLDEGDGLDNGEEPERINDPQGDDNSGNNEGNSGNNGGNGRPEGILNVNENNPLSNAIDRLAEQNYIKDDSLTSTIITYLQQIGL